MRVLIVKTSSMGDVIHTLPALTDAGKALPNIHFDWVVEENFAEIPSWHPLVERVIPVAIRRWRKKIFSSKTRAEWRAARAEINSEQYDFIIDAQGLLKSALLTCFAHGVRAGFDRHSIRDPIAALFYQRKAVAIWKQHAVTRIRMLFSQTLGYELPTSVPDYGIDRKRFISEPIAEAYLVFLHATTWATKHWPEEYWIQLANIANEKGLLVKLPWGTAEEEARAKRIAAACKRAEILPRLDLIGIARVLAGAKAAVSVDTGLGHLSAALALPTVSLYGPTDPALTGALGQSQLHLSTQFSCSPCFSRKCTYPSPLNPPLEVTPPCFTTLPPVVVWDALATLL